VHFEGPVEKLLLAVPNRSQKVDSAVPKGDTLVHSAVTVYPSGSQTFVSRDHLLSLTGEYLIYRDTWVVRAISPQIYPVKASTRGPQRTAPLAPFEKPWFCPIHGSPNFLGEGHISRCTTRFEGQTSEVM